MSKAEEWEPRRSVHRQHLQAEQHPSQLQQRADHRAADHLNRPAVSFSTHRSNFRQGVRRTTPRSVPSTDRSSTYLGSRSSSETYRGSEHRVPNRERGHGDGHSYESLSAKKPLLDDEYEGDGNGDGDDINNSDDYDDVVKFLTGARMTKGESLTTFLDRTKTTATPIVPQYVLPKERLITTPSTQAPIAADTEPIYTRDVKTQKTTLISQAELERRMQALRESISESVPPRRPLSMQPTQEKQRRDLATRSGQINRRDLKDGANYPSQQHTPTASQQQRKQASQQHRMEASQHRREALRSRAHRSDLKHKFSSHLQSWNTHTSWPTMSAGESSASDAPYRSNAARRWRMQHTKGTSRRESISGSMPDSSSSIDSEYRDPVKQISGGLSADPTTSALAPIAERKIRRSYCGWIVIRLFRFFLWTLVSMTIQVVVMGILFRPTSSVAHLSTEGSRGSVPRAVAYSGRDYVADQIGFYTFLDDGFGQHTLAYCHDLWEFPTDPTSLYYGRRISSLRSRILDAMAKARLIIASASNAAIGSRPLQYLWLKIRGIVVGWDRVWNGGREENDALEWLYH